MSWEVGMVMADSSGILSGMPTDIGKCFEHCDAYFFFTSNIPNFHWWFLLGNEHALRNSFTPYCELANRRLQDVWEIKTTYEQEENITENTVTKFHYTQHGILRELTPEINKVIAALMCAWMGYLKSLFCFAFLIIWLTYYAAILNI